MGKDERFGFRLSFSFFNFIIIVVFFFIFSSASPPLASQEMAPPVKISDTPHASKWAQVAFGPDGRIHVCWQEKYIDAAGADIFYASYDGKSWQGPVNLKNSPWASAERPYIHCSQDGHIYVAWDQGNACVLREYDPESNTWLSPVWVSSSAQGGFEPCVTSDPDGNVYVFWYSDQAGVVYTRARIDKTWEPIVRMSSGATSKQGAIAAGRDGWVWSIWREKQPDNMYKIFYSKRNKTTAWTPPRVLTWSGWSAVHPHMTVGPDNFAYVVYADVNPYAGSDAEIWVARIDESSNPRELAIPRALQHYPRIVLDSFGNKHVAVQIGPGDFGWGIWYINNIGGLWKSPQIMPFSSGYTKLPGLAADDFGNVALVWSCTFDSDYEEVWFTSLYPISPKYFFPPLKPLGIISAESSGQIIYQFSWEENPENDPTLIQGYNIYKLEAGKKTKLSLLDKTTFTYTYQAPSGIKREFGITTRAISGAESAMERFEFLYAPQNLKMAISLKPFDPEGKAVYKLFWEPNPENNEARIQGYNIYKKEGDGPFEKILTVEKSTFSASFSFSVKAKKIQLGITTLNLDGRESGLAWFK